MVKHQALRTVLGRREFLAGTAGLVLGIPLASGPALAETGLAGADLGIIADADIDQTAKVQEALYLAELRGLPLLLPKGRIFVQSLVFPSNVRIIGIPGATILAAWGDAPVGAVRGQRNVVLEGLGFSDGTGAYGGGENGLLQVESSDAVTLTSCV